MTPRPNADFIKAMDCALNDCTDNKQPVPGLTSDYLYGFAGDAETTGIELDSCQAYAAHVWDIAKVKP